MLKKKYVTDKKLKITSIRLYIIVVVIYCYLEREAYQVLKLLLTLKK